MKWNSVEKHYQLVYSAQTPTIEYCEGFEVFAAKATLAQETPNHATAVRWANLESQHASLAMVDAAWAYLK